MPFYFWGTFTEYPYSYMLPYNSPVYGDRTYDLYRNKYKTEKEAIDNNGAHKR